MVSVEKTEIYLAGRNKKSMTANEWKWYRRRNGIESIIGHTKQDHWMDRTYLKGEVGDKINAILTGCGINLRKLLIGHLMGYCRRGLRLEAETVEQSREDSVTD